MHCRRPLVCRLLTGTVRSLTSTVTVACQCCSVSTSPKQEQLPIKMFVFNNSSLGMVKLEMLVQGLPEHETDHESVNFAKIAEASGIKHFRIEDPKDAPEQVKQALAYNGPALIDVVTDPNALSLPPTLTIEQLMGFSKAATRTGVGGGVGQMINMARSNLRNIPRP